MGLRANDAKDRDWKSGRQGAGRRKRSIQSEIFCRRGRRRTPPQCHSQVKCQQAETGDSGALPGSTDPQQIFPGSCLFDATMIDNQRQTNIAGRQTNRGFSGFLFFVSFGSRRRRPVNLVFVSVQNSCFYFYFYFFAFLLHFLHTLP